MCLLINDSEFRFEWRSNNSYLNFTNLGAGMIEREQARKFKPYVEFSPTSDGKWKQRTKLGLKNLDVCFVPGEEFDELFYGTKLKVKA